MSSPPQITALIRQPDALRGLDHLIEYARSVVYRYMRVPEHPEKPLSRAA